MDTGGGVCRFESIETIGLWRSGRKSEQAVRYWVAKLGGAVRLGETTVGWKEEEEEEKETKGLSQIVHLPRSLSLNTKKRGRRRKRGERRKGKQKKKEREEGEEEN